MLKVLMSRFATTALMVAPECQEQFKACLEGLAQSENVQKVFQESASVSGDDFWPAPDDWRASYRPYKVVNGVLQVPVRGVLLHDFPWQVGSWATGYQYIYKAVERGMADGNVRAVAFLINSPGGEVAGNFDLVDRLASYRGMKPMRAFAHEFAYSAAYNIAAVADKITVSRTGGVGSIGVITSHMDMSKMLDEWGLKVTFIYAGKHKKDGNQYEPLPEDVRARVQERIDSLYADFVSAVARNRGMSEEAVRATEAQTFMASEATSNGLADAIGPLDEAMAAFVADLSHNEGDEEMSDKTKDNAAANEAVEKARAEAHVAGREEGFAAGKAEGFAEGAKAERERISAIMESDEAKCRPVAARNVAMKTDMGAEEAVSFLAALPEEPSPKAEANEAGAQQQSGASAFKEAMEKTGNPDLSADDGGQAKADSCDDILATVGLAGIPGFSQPGQ